MTSKWPAIRGPQSLYFFQLIYNLTHEVKMRALSQKNHVSCSRFTSIVFAFLLLSLFAMPAQAAKNFVFIFDASGSMWGQISGKNKIVIAKEAMDEIVNGLPDDLNVGLVAYGHNRKGDCDDVETLIPLGKLDRKSFLAKIKAINPKGKTPMIRSIRKTADSIKHLEDETAILLISDGKETCDPDPCSIVAELKKLGIKFVLHVVGFDVGGETEEQLKCMARAGGGEYFPARDAGNLKGALDSVVKKAVAQNLVVTVFDADNNAIPVMIQVLDGNGNVIDSDGGRRVGFGLPAGTYTLKVNPDNLSEKKTIENVVVAEDKVTEQKVVFAESRVVVGMKDGSGQDIPGYVRIVNVKTGQYAEEGDHTGKTTAFVVSPGEYVVDMECSNTGRRVKSEPFLLKAGESHEVAGVCANVRIGVLVTSGGKPITGYVRLVDVPKDVYAEEADSHPTMRFFKVPPGTYKVDIECPGEHRVRSEVFDLQVGQEATATIDCKTKKSTLTLP